MIVRSGTTVTCVVAMLIVCAVPASSTSAAGEATGGAHPSDVRPGGSSSRGRVLGMVVGAAGGFAFGLFVGLDRFDDAIDSDRKVWTAAVVGAAGGAVAGYFIGRAVAHDPTNTAGPIRTAAARTRRAQPLPSLPRLTSSRVEPHRSFRALFAP